MNAKIVQSAGFENVFVPPAPGDEGIAVGCAMYGLQVRRRGMMMMMMIVLMMVMYVFDDDDDIND